MRDTDGECVVERAWTGRAARVREEVEAMGVNEVPTCVAATADDGGGSVSPAWVEPQHPYSRMC